MPLELGPQCCDANSYLNIGYTCAAHVELCWSPLRPIGTGLFFSLPFRLGLPVESLVVINTLLAALSVWAGFTATTAVLPRGAPLARALLFASYVGIHGAFFGGLLRNSVSDVPAAVLAMSSIWMLILGGAKARTWYYGAGGAALGLAAIVRSFYLYPAFIALFGLAGFALVGRVGRARAALFIGTCLLPIAVQYGITHSRTGTWTFIDPGRTALAEKEHFDNNLYGYDTVITQPGWHVEYAAPECFSGADVMSDALRKGDARAIGCLWARRQWFYLGSFVPGGRAYLSSAGERRFSLTFLALNTLVLVCGAAWALRRAGRAVLFAVPLTLLAATWGEASFILPEARFLIVFHVVLWMLCAAGAYEFAHSRMPARAPPAMTTSRPFDISSLWARGMGELRRRRPVLLAAVIGASMAVQGMAVLSNFDAEDLRHLYQSRALATSAHLLLPCDGYFCATFRVVTALMHGIFGVHPVAFYALVLLTHLANAALLFAVIRALGPSKLVAFGAAALWGAAPAFQGTLQDFSAYSHVLAASATLWSLWEIARAVEARRPPSAWAVLRTNLVLAAGAATGLDGAVTAIVFPIVTYFLLRPESAPRPTAALLLPASALSLVAVSVNAARLNGLSSISAAVTFFRLVVYGAGALVAGPFVTLDPRGALALFDRGSPTIAVYLSLPFFCALGFVIVRRLVQSEPVERRVILGMLGLSAAAYLGALGARSSLPFDASSVWAASRYQYGATFGLVVALALAVNAIRSEWSWPQRRFVRIGLALSLAGWVAVCFVAARRTYGRDGGDRQWTRDSADLVMDSLRLSISRCPSGDVLYVENDPFRPASPPDAPGTSRADFPGIAAYWIASAGTDDILARTIRFVERDGRLLREVRRRSLPDVSRMFVPPEAVERAHAPMHSIAADAPAEIAQYLEDSENSAVRDHRRAVRLRSSLSELMDGLADAVAQTKIRGRGAVDPEEALRDALSRDPAAKESLRKAIANDPAAMESLRREMQGGKKP